MSHETYMIRVTHGNQVSTLEVPSVDLQGVRPLRVDGLLTAEVRETSADERRCVVDRPYAASWLGWSRGCTPGDGATPDEAVRALAAGEVAS